MSVPLGTSTEGGTLDFALGILLISGMEDGRNGEGKGKKESRNKRRKKDENKG
jgi:hypothetical protein